jgi:serine protease Do
LTKGQVIGVNTAIDARAQGNGFAIPIDYVKNILNDLKNKGKVTRGYLGVGLAEFIHPQAARELGLPNNKGALVINVEPGSPADRGGIKTYDVIVKLGSREIADSSELRRAVLDQPLGKPVDVELFHEGKKRKLTLTLGEQASKVQQAKREPEEKPQGQKTSFNLGIKIENMTSALAKKYELKVNTGVLVTDVAPNSPAALNGLTPGDVIVDVNRNPVRTVEEVSNNLKLGVNALKINRRGSVALIFIEAE